VSSGSAVMAVAELAALRRSLAGKAWAGFRGARGVRPTTKAGLIGVGRGLDTTVADSAKWRA
jgi:hypothetical protein